MPETARRFWRSERATGSGRRIVARLGSGVRDAWGGRPKDCRDVCFGPLRPSRLFRDLVALEATGDMIRIGAEWLDSVQLKCDI